MNKGYVKASIIIPAYNEGKRIGKTLEEYGQYFENIKKTGFLEGDFDFEILVVLNNCRDNTLDVVKAHQKKYPEILYLNFEQGGKGFAITEGFKDALRRDNSLIGFVDADFATPPREFFDLIKKIQGYDGVIASRAMKGSKANFTLKRKITHRGFNFLVRGVLFLNYKDTQCGAKIFKREVIEKVVDKIGITKWAYDIDLLYKIKKDRFKIREIPTLWEDKEGTSMNVISTTLQMFFAVVRLRLLNSWFKGLIRLYDKLPKKLQIHY